MKPFEIFSAEKMSSTVGCSLPGSDGVKLNLEETELTLALPGESRRRPEIMARSGAKRSFSQTVGIRTPAVGWPPVRATRKNAIKRTKLVKVAVDGAPYLRKIDLELYKSYQQLLSALEQMFSCLEIRMRPRIPNSKQLIPIYEDGDGDWMLVGDMPWKLFVESCKKLRFMKSSEETVSSEKLQPPL